MIMASSLSCLINGLVPLKRSFIPSPFPKTSSFTVPPSQKLNTSHLILHSNAPTQAPSPKSSTEYEKGVTGSRLFTIAIVGPGVNNNFKVGIIQFLKKLPGVGAIHTFDCSGHEEEGILSFTDLKLCLQGVEIVIFITNVPSGASTDEEMFRCNGLRLKPLLLEVTAVCPEAWLLMASYPIVCTVPMAATILKKLLGIDIPGLLVELGSLALGSNWKTNLDSPLTAEENNKIIALFGEESKEKVFYDHGIVVRLLIGRLVNACMRVMCYQKEVKVQVFSSCVHDNIPSFFYHLVKLGHDDMELFGAVDEQEIMSAFAASEKYEEHILKSVSMGITFANQD